MGRKATGQIIERKLMQGTTYGIRFRAYGKRYFLTLGPERDGWTWARAETELRHTLADVERGIWRPPVQEIEPAPERPVPTFHEFASEWLASREPELAPKTVENYRWALSNHLLPFFAGHQLPAITAEEVDRYKTAKLREGKIAPNQINTTLTRLAQILEEAVEYGHLDRNVARGRRRRVKGTRPARSWVEPEQLPSLLDAADRQRRPLLATLAGAGLRVGEAVALDWRDINLATATLTVRRSKTDAGTDRRVDLTRGLQEELIALKARSDYTAPSDPVFVTRAGVRQSVSNVGRRLKTTVKRANTKLAALDIEPIGERVSPHSLRRTYASLRAALRDDPVYIAEQLGHEEASFSMSVYAKGVKRRERLVGNYLTEFDRACEWAQMGTSGPTIQRPGVKPRQVRTEETA